MDLTRAALLACACACGSGKPKVADDAKRPAPAGDAAATRDAAAPAPTPTATTGDVQIRVEWPDVPLAARTSPGATSCGTPRAAAVAPTTTWGIPEALVIVDGAPPVTGEVHVRLADCALTPRFAVGDTLALDTTSDHPEGVRVGTSVKASRLPEGLPDAGPGVPVHLPIAGYTVKIPITPGDIVAVRGPDGDVAWVSGGVGTVTDASGVALVKDVPVGVHTVRAWLPPRATQDAFQPTSSQFAKGTITVVAGELAELTLTLAPDSSWPYRTPGP